MLLRFVGRRERRKKAVGAFYEVIKTFSRNWIAALKMIMQFYILAFFFYCQFIRVADGLLNGGIYIWTFHGTHTQWKTHTTRLHGAFNCSSNRPTLAALYLRSRDFFFLLKSTLNHKLAYSISSVKAIIVKHQNLVSTMLKIESLWPNIFLCKAFYCLTYSSQLLISVKYANATPISNHVWNKVCYT